MALRRMCEWSQLWRCQFFKQREAYFICEIENDSGSSCGEKIAVNSGQVTNMTRRVMRSHEETYKNMLESKVEASPKQAVMDKYLRSSKINLTNIDYL